MNSIFPPKPEALTLPKVGDYLCGSYGYEACIHHVVKVVGVTPSMVKVQEVELDSKYAQGGMEWTSKITNRLSGPVKSHRFKAGEKGYRIKRTECLSMSGPWTPCELSGYNYH